MSVLDVTGVIGQCASIDDAVYIAIGAASMCWDENRVFMSEEAKLISRALIARIEQG